MMTPEHFPQLSAAFKQAGFTHVSPWGPAGLEARTPTLRCVEVAGDHLFATVSLAPDGALRYDYLWRGALPYESIPTARPEKTERQIPLLTRKDAPAPGLFRISVTPSGDPAGVYQHVQVETSLASPADLPALLATLGHLGQGYNGPYGKSKAEAAPMPTYYLMELAMVATFREVVGGEDRGFTAYVTTHVTTHVEGSDSQKRARIMQIDLAGQAHRYEIVADARGVFVDLPTSEGGRHQDWIWQLPIMERTWTENDPEAGTVTYQISRIPDPVEVEAGVFENCIRLTSSSEKGQATHTYSPVAGLIKSHFLLDGLDGKRELWDIEKDYSWVSGGCHAATGQPEHEGQEPPASAAIPTPKRES